MIDRECPKCQAVGLKPMKQIAELNKESIFRKYTPSNIKYEDVTSLLQLKYVNGESVIHELTRISTPGRRQYEKSKKMTPVIGGLGVAIVTTSHGIMSDRQAKKLGIGGEVICHVW